MKNEFPSAGWMHQTPEELILPPNSKVHADVELVLDANSSKKMTSSVVTEPFANDGTNFWAARTCSKLRDNQFMTEFINPTNDSVRIEAGQIIGFAEFIEEAKFNASTQQTKMSCTYSDDSGYESNADSEAEDEADADEEAEDGVGEEEEEHKFLR